jgi:hypothetical protein
MSMTIKKGHPTEHCQCCGAYFNHLGVAIDCSLNLAPGKRVWGWACQECHELYGIGLGIGKGQLYCLDRSTNEWIQATQVEEASNGKAKS